MKQENSIKLEDAPNLGKILSQKLRQAEITDLNILTALGTEQAYIKLITIDPEMGCPQVPWALEGAIQSIRWHDLNKSRRNELKDYYNFISSFSQKE